MSVEKITPDDVLDVLDVMEHGEGVFIDMLTWEFYPLPDRAPMAYIRRIVHGLHAQGLVEVFAANAVSLSERRHRMLVTADEESRQQLVDKGYYCWTEVKR